jgi:hypothetical protein
MSIFSPRFSGHRQINASPETFLTGIKNRVESGLLTGKPHRRSRYVVTNHTEGQLTFRASDTLTAINIGLNDVTLRAEKDHEVAYSVSYRKWAKYVLGLSLSLGAVLVGVFFLRNPGAQMEASPVTSDPVLTRTLFWGLVGFWALVWPWVLIAMHRPFARKALDRIIREVDSAVR